MTSRHRSTPPASNSPPPRAAVRSSRPPRPPPRPRPLPRSPPRCPARRRRGPRLPARRRIRRPAARRHPAVDPRDAHPRGDARLRARPGPVTVSWEVAEDKALHQGRRQGHVHRDRRLRPHRQGRRPRTAARPPPTSSASGGGDATPPSAAPAPRPADDAAAAGLRFGVVSCANWEAGYFSPYRHLAARGDLDAGLHLGDYIYEYGTGEYAGAGTSSARTQPDARDPHASPTTASGTPSTRPTPTCRPCTPRTRSSRSGTTTSSPTTPGPAAPRTTPRARRAPGRTA